MHSEIIPSIKMINCTSEGFTLKIHTLNNYHQHHSVLSFGTKEMQPCIQRGNQLKTSKWPPLLQRQNILMASKHLYRVTKNKIQKPFVSTRMKLKQTNERVLQKFMTVGGKHPHCAAKHPVKKQKAENTLN